MSSITASHAGTQDEVVESREAGEALVKGAVRLNTTTGKVEQTDTQGEKAYGVVDKAYSSGEMAKVVRLGLVELYCTTASGVTTVGAEITPSVEGSADAGKVEVAASGDWIMGHSNSIPAADDDIFGVWIDCINPTAAKA